MLKFTKDTCAQLSVACGKSPWTQWVQSDAMMSSFTLCITSSGQKHQPGLCKGLVCASIDGRLGTRGQCNGKDHTLRTRLERAAQTGKQAPGLAGEPKHRYGSESVHPECHQLTWHWLSQKHPLLHTTDDGAAHHLAPRQNHSTLQFTRREGEALLRPACMSTPMRPFTQGSSKTALRPECAGHSTAPHRHTRPASSAVLDLLPAAHRNKASDTDHRRPPPTSKFHARVSLRLVPAAHTVNQLPLH